MILYEKQLVFIHIPKCAGSSIEKAFNYIDDFESYGVESLGPDHRPIRAMEQGMSFAHQFSSWENFTEFRRRLRHKPKPNPVKNLLLTPEQYSQFYKFTFVRNPWARAHSMYKHIMREEHKQRRYKMDKLQDTSFATFLKAYAGKKDIQSQMYWLKDFSGEVPFDFIGKFENLNQDFEQLCSNIGCESITLPHVYKGSGGDFRKAYSTELVDLVADVYQEEIEYFDYRFE